ncbi:hypothetical protein [Encephalitozoon cuniculi GB-M1]|uniref:Uncharacterized protein n=1 Tax=Encephalitozoon cuniculi (strain GB-M1) TaxID=284813 RepID=Q8SV97_ENCCU|nr:uncharacterized protein ECU06_1070 [Encephalitozoon cuniculi GB-M1]CAD25467.2 hypothetical protein [Encephalitozoon cuniculi GB-M1]
MGEDKVTCLSEKKIAGEILTLVSLCFMIVMQCGDMGGLLVNYTIKIIVFVNFFYQAGSFVWRFFINIQERKSLVNGVFSVKNMIEVLCLCALVLYFKKVVGFLEVNKERADMCVIAVSMGYLLSKIHEVLDYSTLQYHWSKMIFSAVIILMIGAAVITDARDDGEEGVFTELAYVVSVILTMVELAIEGRVVEKVVFRYRMFSITVAFLLLSVVSSPGTYPVAKKYTLILIGWVTDRVIEWIWPHLSRLKQKILSASKEQVQSFVKEYTKKMVPSIVKRTVQEHIPNLKNAIKAKVEELMPQAFWERVGKLPSSFREWWIRPPSTTSSPTDGSQPIEFD